MNALASVDSLVVIGDVESFGQPLTITHDGEFVQVTIAPHFKPATTYCKRVNYGSNEDRCSHVADEVEKVAALVSHPSLVAWLLDCGFVALT